MWNEILTKYLHEEKDVTEFQANGPGLFFIKESGMRKQIKIPLLEDEQAYIDSIDELCDLIGVDTDREFLFEGKLSLETGERARVHILLPPACDYPQITVAKRADNLKTLTSLRETGTFNKLIQDFLEAAIHSKATIAISGGSGAGKTTLLEAITREFSLTERIGVVEDTPELVLSQPNTTYLSATLWKPGMDPNDVATLSWCVKQINRQRADKIIIGETRGAEFADFIVAANSGCEGSLTSIHANNAKSAVRKMTNFVMQGIPQSTRAANESISQTVNLVIQIGLNRKGQHRIMEIQEVTEVLGNDEHAPITLHGIFKYSEETDGWERNQVTDNFRARFERSGYDPLTYKKRVERVVASETRSPLSGFQRRGL